MQKIISCDWGSSALRLRLVDTAVINVLTEVAGSQGISATYELWKQSGKKEEGRLAFYQSVIGEQIREIESQLNSTLDGIPVVISGMASSNIGMLELPYKETPFSTDGHDLLVRIIEPGENFNHRTLLISGVKTGSDVMRGEETQLIGCSPGSGLFILPGTHSKHVRVENGRVVDIKTYMTGEFFELLSKKSILSNTIIENQDLSQAAHLKSFRMGVLDSLDSNILHSSFLVRTNFLLDKLTKEENYHYLSGLLIGSELKEIVGPGMPLTVAADNQIGALYRLALEQLGITGVKYIGIAKAVAEAHCKVFNLHKSEMTA